LCLGGDMSFLLPLYCELSGGFVSPQKWLTRHHIRKWTGRGP